MKQLPARRTADGSWTLYSERYQQTFHSHHGAVSESRHVFVEGSGVAQRLKTQKPCTILEVGFGSGLNFFLSADLAQQHGTALHYLTLEQDLLSAEVIAGLGFEDYVSASLLSNYAKQRRSLATACPAGSYQLRFELVTLNLLIGQATLQALPEDQFHAVYHDAFSPDANPELWSEAFLSKLFASLTTGGILTTYSVKGAVRRRLQGLGFEVHKAAGPAGGKREMLVARKP